MKIGKLFFLLLLSFSTISAQNPKLWGNLTPDKYSVGFKVFHEYDFSRVIIDNNNNEKPRPVQICVWYPAEINNQVPKMKFLDYVKLTLTEKEFGNKFSKINRDEMLNNFKGFLLGNLFDKNASYDSFANLFNTQTAAVANAKPSEGKFPLFYIALGNYDSPHRYSQLAEFLASHGYVVATSPSPSRILDDNTVLEQVDDIKFAVNIVYNRFDNINTKDLVLLGFSLGGSSGGEYLLQYPTVDAFICLDCTIANRFGAAILQAPAYPLAKNRNVPFLNIQSQKDNVGLIASFKYSDHYFLRIPDFSHFNFTSSGIIAGNYPTLVSNKRWLNNFPKSIKGYEAISSYVLNFLDGYLKDDKDALQFLKNTPVANGYTGIFDSTDNYYRLRSEVPKQSDFFSMILDKGIDVAYDLYNDLISENKNLYIFNENDFNNFIYNNFMNKNKFKESIKLFTLLAERYPQSANTWDSLAEAYMNDNQIEPAIRSYKKSLKLNPNNQNAEKNIKYLGNKL